MTIKELIKHLESITDKQIQVYTKYNTSYIQPNLTIYKEQRITPENMGRLKKRRYLLIE